MSYGAQKKVKISIAFVLPPNGSRYRIEAYPTQWPTVPRHWYKFPIDTPRQSIRTIAYQESEWDVIVIGAGVGGLSCTALTSAYGFKTLVLESHYALGGWHTVLVKVLSGLTPAPPFSATFLRKAA